jgi:hypothetical protein
MVKPKHFGFVASAVNLWFKNQQQQKKDEGFDIVNEFPDLEIGDKGTNMFQLMSKYQTEGIYGITTIYRLLSPEGHIYVWFSSGADKIGEWDGFKVLSFKVKDKKIWKDEHQTYIFYVERGGIAWIKKENRICKTCEKSFIYNYRWKKKERLLHSLLLKRKEKEDETKSNCIYGWKVSILWI